MLLLLVTAALGAEPQSLVIGNSYVITNDLDRLLADLWVDGGEPQAITRLAAGGYSFADHVALADGSAGDTPWRESLVTGTRPLTWALLQEQSQVPGFSIGDPYQVESLASAHTLSGWVTDKGGETGAPDEAAPAATTSRQSTCGCGSKAAVVLFPLLVLARRKETA